MFERRFDERAEAIRKRKKVALLHTASTRSSITKGIGQSKKFSFKALKNSFLNFLNSNSRIIFNNLEDFRTQNFGGQKEMKNKYEREKIRKLDVSTWEQPYLNYNLNLISFATLRFTKGDRSLAEELVQDTFCRVISYSSNLAKINNPLGYLKKTMKNLWIDQWKKSGGIRMLSIDDDNEEKREALINELPSVEPDIHRILENEELSNQLRIATGNLKPSERDVFRLFLRGLDCREIATLLNKDVYRINYELNAVRAKIRYRVNPKAKTAKP